MNTIIKIKRAFFYAIIGISIGVTSCNNTSNETNNDTNTHNTSQSSPVVHSKDIPMDPRNFMPANRLNDGNQLTINSHSNSISADMKNVQNENSLQNRNDSLRQADVQPAGDETSGNPTLIEQ